MKNVSLSYLENNLDEVLKNIVRNNDKVRIKTEKGNLIALSKQEYDSLLATIEISNDLKLKEKILKGKNTKVEDCIDINEIKF